MIHEETVFIPKAEFERINRLLAIPSLEEMTDAELMEAGANTHHCEGVFYVEFDDGSKMNWDLCSGAVNYFDDVVWTNAEDDVDVILGCEFELDDIEIDIGGETYVVHIDVI